MSPDPDLNDPTPGMHIWGWMLPVELRWLMAQAERMESVVEIGSLHGRSAFAIATACPGPVICVDTWSDEHDKSYDSFMGNAGKLPNVHPFRMWSHEAARAVPAAFPDGVDMTFIDGSHVYESVIADIAAWLPHTRKLICGHDYNPEGNANFPSVAKAAHDVFGDRVQVGEETSIWHVDLEADRSVAAGLPSGMLRFTDEYDREMEIEVTW